MTAQHQQLPQTSSVSSSATTSASSSANIPSSSRNSMTGRSSRSTKRSHREVRFGSYVLGSTLGEGEFGKVKLGWRKDGKTPSQAAIKLIRRESIPRGSDRESKVHREINSLKRLAHPNIVRLEEVLQNDKYIGIVLEYASGGELFDYILEHRYLKDSMACKLFAQLVSGVDYMHSKGIVHRDLKLENLLLDKHKNIIISDFGFVNSFRDGNELMKTSCGSPCYAAPELVVSSEPYEARKVDVWSCGVILYAMLAGYLPFDDDPQNPDGDNIARLYHYITHTPLTFPEYVQPVPRDLLRKIIVSSPKKRISLKEARSHTWLAPHAPFLSVTPQEWDKSYRSARSRLHSNVDSENRRHSLMEGNVSHSHSGITSPPAFLMNNNNKNRHTRSYSTQNVTTQQLYSHPLAPQTSSSHAIATMPSSSSSPRTSNEYSSPLLSANSPYTQTNSPSVFVTPMEHLQQLHHHQRQQNNSSIQRNGSSTSTASMALQAVVQADVVERRNSISTVDSSSGFVRPDNIQHQQKATDGNKISFNSYNNASHSSLANIDETSTVKMMLPPTITNIPKSSGSSSTNNSARLPMPHVKPRPTSYHPGSFSALSNSNSEYYSLLPFTLSSSSVLSSTPTQIPKLIPSPVLPSSPVLSSEISPQRLTNSHEKRNSWSKISEPLLDMSIASGMLSHNCENGTSGNSNNNTVTTANNTTKTTSISNNNNSNNGDTNKTERRKSVAIDSLSNAIESLNSRDQQLDLSSSLPSTATSAIEKLDQLDTPTSRNNNGKGEDDEKDEVRTLPTPATTVLPELFPEPVVVTSVTQVEVPEVVHRDDELKKKEAIDIKPASTTPNSNQTQPLKNPQSSQYNSTHENKENKPSTTQATATATQKTSTSSTSRSKRFSFFYSSTPLPPSIPEQESTNLGSNVVSTEKNKQSSSKLRTANSSSSSTSSSGNRRILEPSNETNIMKPSSRLHMLDDTATKKQNRMSSIGVPRQKETSAAKKVVDFFKRRSMRV